MVFKDKFDKPISRLVANAQGNTLYLPKEKISIYTY